MFQVLGKRNRVRTMRSLDLPNTVDILEGMELENAFSLVGSYREYIKRCPEHRFIKRILMHIANGNYEQYKRSIDSAHALIHSQAYTNGSFSGLKGGLIPLTQDGVRRKLYENVIKLGHDRESRTTVFMYLCVTHQTRSYKRQDCHEANHGYCRILLDLLNHASPTAIRDELMICSKIGERTAVHLAAASGQACQLATLLKSGIYLDPTDRSGRTPLHYAIDRSNIILALILVWKGADSSKSEDDRPHSSPKLLSLSKTTTQQLGKYLNNRLDYASRKFMNWVSDFCGEHFDIRQTTCSEIHSVRFSRDSDDLSISACTREDLLRSVMLEFKTNVAAADLSGGFSPSLFMIPVFYRPHPNGENPELCRTDFFSSCNQVERVISGRVLFKGDYMGMFLESAIEPEHNGFFYMYSLPNHIVPETHQIFFNLDVKCISKEQLQSCFFLVGVVATKRKTPLQPCSPPTNNSVKHKKD